MLSNKPYVFFLLMTIFLSYSSIADDTTDQIEQKKLHYNSTPKPPQVHRVLIYKDSKNEKCDEVHDHLKKHNIEYNDIDLSWNRKQRMILERKAGKKDISYVFIGNKYIGNHKELMHILKQGKLHNMIYEE